jgi:hypothetical protein
VFNTHDQRFSFFEHFCHLATNNNNPVQLDTKDSCDQNILKIFYLPLLPAARFCSFIFLMIAIVGYIRKLDKNKNPLT